MPTIRSRSRGRRGSWLVAGAVAAATVLSGCSPFGSHNDPHHPASGATPATSATSATAALPTVPDVVAALHNALDSRAAAVRSDDRGAFLAGLAHGDHAFRAAQSTYLDNLHQLPVGVFSYSFDPADLVRQGDDYWIAVDLHLQLTGFDARPSVSVERYRFTPGRPGHYLLAAVGDPSWDARHDVEPQPWDTGPIVVRSAPRVLVIFDPQSVTAAGPLLIQLQRGIANVSSVVPYSWPESVVVYALSDTSFLYSIPDLPTGDPTTLDAVAFPVRASPGSTDFVATRIAMNPRLLHSPGPSRDRLLRHELTHVAIGRHDDRAPVWLSEGLAEYVSVRALAPSQRGITRSAIRAAKAGFADLPGDSEFEDGDAGAHYGEAWFACEYIAQHDGEPMLWKLLHRLDKPNVDQETVLQRTIGLSSMQLAHRAGRLLLLTYKPGQVLP